MTAVQYFDEQMQERVIAQDVVARKMIIEISMEDYMDIKRQSNKMFKQQIIDASERLKWVDYSLVQNGEQYYNENYGSGVLTEGSGAVGDKGGAVNKGSDDQVPDVRNMVDVIKWIDEEILLNPHYADSQRLREGAHMVKVKLQQSTSSQTEISDEELQEIIRASDILSMHGKIPNEYREGYRHGLEYYHNTLKRKSK